MKSCRTTALMPNACSANASRRIQSGLHLAPWEAAPHLSTERRGFYSRDLFRSFATEQKGVCDPAFFAPPFGNRTAAGSAIARADIQVGANAFFESNERK